MENKKDSYLLKVLLFALSDPNFGKRMKCLEKQIKEEKEKSKKRKCIL